MAVDPIWSQHRIAAFATFGATPIAGMAQVFIAEPLAADGGSGWLIYQWTVWLMMLSVVVSWLVLLAVLPLAVYADRRFGPAFWLALPIGAIIGWGIGQVFGGGTTFDPTAIAAGITGAVMAAIYCIVLWWLRAAPT